MLILGHDPRVTGDIEVTYEVTRRRFADRLIDYLIILPFYQDYTQAKTTRDTLVSTGNNRELIYTDKWLDTIKEKHRLVSFMTIDELLSYFYVNPSPSNNVLNYLNVALFGFSLPVSGTPTPLVNDRIIPLRFLYYALSIGGARAHVLFYNYHPSSGSISLANVYRDVIQNSTYVKDLELFISAGLDASDFVSDRLMYLQIAALYDVIRGHNEDIMYVLDAHPRYNGKHAYQRFLQTYASYNTPSHGDFNKILLSGWFRYIHHIMPPSFAYLMAVLYNYNLTRRFDSIVNKPLLALKNAIPMLHEPAGIVRSDSFEDNQLIEGFISTANRLYKPYKKYLVFLTDYTLLRERNMLRYENAVRAALYGKKLVESIMMRYIGMREADLDLSMIERLVNEELKEEPDLVSFIVIPKEQPIPGQITANYYIKMGLTIYTIHIVLQAKEA